MERTVSCVDIGFLCSWSSCGQDAEAAVADMTEHLHRAHHVTPGSMTVTEYLSQHVREDAAPDDGKRERRQPAATHAAHTVFRRAARRLAAAVRPDNEDR
jgi:predicted small metal-binding protein